MEIIKKLGSLYATVIISLFVMILLIFSTFFESAYGTPTAQKIFYQTKWFDLALSLFWINIFCATIFRFPFRKNHIGFLLTHIGILGLLAGALISRVFGFEGQMLILEKKTSNQIKQNSYELTVTPPDRNDVVVVLPSKISKIPIQDKNISMSIKNIFENANEKFIVEKGGNNAIKNHAIKLTLKSSQLNLNQSVTLIEKHPNNPQSTVALAGPVRLTLHKESPAQSRNKPILRILNTEGQESALIYLQAGHTDKVPIIGTDLYIDNIKYYERARVIKGKVTNASDASINPAVEFDAFDQNGNKKHYIKFAYYPDYGAIHGKQTENKNFNIEATLETPHQKSDHLHAGPQLSFSVLSNETWEYQIKTKENSVINNPVQLDQWVSSGWLDMKFRIDEVFSHAIVSRKTVNSPIQKQGNFAVEIFTADNDKNYTQWIKEGQRLGLRSSQGNYYFELQSKTKLVPFSLHLEDFRKQDYPGTNRPASFESDVNLLDENNNKVVSKTISMNKPLDYKGFRIFQSSFIQNPKYGEASIFRVAKNPGIPWIYMSSCILFVGSFLQFYVKKFSRS